MQISYALASALHAHGVRTVFGIPGTDNTRLFLDLHRVGIQTIVPRNEVFAPIMAEGYALTKHTGGVFVTIPGPGALATLPGLLDASKSKLPVLGIVIDIPSTERGKHRGYLHEVEGGLKSFFSPLATTTYTQSWSDVQHSVQLFDSQRTTSACGPHAIIIPTDILERDADGLGYIESAKESSAKDHGVDVTMDGLAKILSRAKRPLFLAGRGVEHAGAELLLDRLARNIGAPILTSVSGLGMLPHSTERINFGQLHVEPEIQSLIAQSDCVVMWGTRTSQRSWWGHLPSLPDPCITVNHRHEEHDPYTPYHVTEDLYRVVTYMLSHTSRTQHARWLTRWRSTARRILARLNREHPPEMGIIQIIEQVRTKRPVTIWADSTKLSYWMRRYLTGAGAFRFPMGSGMIGWALSAGIGGAVASREMLEDMEHVVVIGDGGLLFTQSELSTVQALGVPLTILLIDNTSYGIIADYHVARYGQASTATDLPSTDWKSVAEAFEIDYLSAHTHDDLREMLRDVPARPRLIQLHISIGKPRIP